MNDFLKSLRANNNNNNKDKRFDRNNNRKYYNNPQYNNGNSQYRGNEKGNGRNVPGTTISGDILPQIATLLENIAESQKRAAIAQERRAEAAENIAEALQQILGNRIAVSPEPGEILPATMEPSAHASSVLPRPESGEPSGTAADRDSVIRLIQAMRADGATYADIAAHLDSLNILTFSGKGKWHAQTIHRLCRTEE